MKKETKKMPRWTEKEEKQLLELISENSGNLQDAFRLFCIKHPNRTVKAAMNKWYQSLRSRKDTKVCMMTIDKKHTHINSKNIGSNFFSHKVRKGIWGKILNLILGN